MAIREAAVYADWRGDYRALGLLLEPPITEAQARDAVAELVEMGLLTRGDNGRYSQGFAVATTVSMPGHLVRKARRQFIDLAQRASETMSPAQRHLSSSTVSLDMSQYMEAQRLIDELRAKLMAMAESAGSPERVYQFNAQLFPLSKAFTDTGSPSQAVGALRAIREQGELHLLRSAWR
jgi:uncharacterized protein (TIGR02147 family)